MKNRKAAESVQQVGMNGHNGDHTPFTLDEIRASVKDLCAKVPPVPPEGIDAKDIAAVEAWAQVRNVMKLLLRRLTYLSCRRLHNDERYSRLLLPLTFIFDAPEYFYVYRYLQLLGQQKLKAVIEEFELLLCCVAGATYK